MTPGTILDLTKTITTKSGGCIASYKLSKNAFVKVLVLPHVHTPTEESELYAVDRAAELARRDIKNRYEAQRKYINYDVTPEGKK